VACSTFGAQLLCYRPIVVGGRLMSETAVDLLPQVPAGRQSTCLAPHSLPTLGGVDQEEHCGVFGLAASTNGLLLAALAVDTRPMLRRDAIR
jgi:hypothetical protein